MIIIVSVAILLTIALTAYIVLKCVMLGLTWQIETKQDIKPTMPNIITEQLEKKEQMKQNELSESIVNEYLFGGDPK